MSCSRNFVSQPALGGSIIIDVFSPSNFFETSAKIVSALPMRNSQLSILFIFAFALAQTIAFELISTPATFSNFFADANANTPTPQYASTRYFVPCASASLLQENKNKLMIFKEALVINLYCFFKAHSFIRGAIKIIKFFIIFIIFI